MRILHTADWHIGQTLNGWPREAEHRAFLDRLGDVIAHKEIDALLVAGDVFDGINPSGEAQRLLYSAIAGFLRRRPGLTVVMIAGNHDPAARLEAPEAVLAALGVHVVGTLRRRGDTPDMTRHLVPLRDAAGSVQAQVLALPFLRAGDLPGLTLSAGSGQESTVVAATRALLARAVAAALPLAGGAPLIGMGHLTCAGGLESEGAERRILIGGEHAVPPDIFPPALAYVALGHLHRAQGLDGGRIRYPGSPFPLSATEAGHDQGVTLIESGPPLTWQHLSLPRPAPVLRLPAEGALTVEELAAGLAALDLDPGAAGDLRPLIYVVLRADRPAPVLRAAAEALIAERPVRLAGLSIERAGAGGASAPPPSLAETTPEALFAAAFRETHGIAPGPAHLAAFRDALAEV